MLRSACAAVFVFGALAACATTSDDETASSEAASSKGSAGSTRDFHANPAIFETDNAGDVYAVSDPHGEYDVLLGLLAGNALVDHADPDPTKVHWAGGAATLVVAGDLIDKGAKSIETIDLLRSLQSQAPRSGGQVIVTMGNHEAELFADPTNSKATSTGLDTEGIDIELAKRGIDPKAFAAGNDPEGRGRWLQSVPLGARVKKWFFCHAGNTQKLSIKDLGNKLEKSLSNNGFGDKDITGNDSILESQSWYGKAKDSSAGADEVKALGNVNHIVFGHDPSAFDAHGKILQSNNGLLVKLDTAMGLHDDGKGGSSNPAYLLHISTRGTDTVEVLDANGSSSPLGTP